MPTLMDMFRSVTGSAAPAAPTTTNPAANTSIHADANTMIPNANTPRSDGTLAAIPPAATGDKSPLADFAELFKVDPENKNVSPSLVPSMTMDPAKLSEGIKKMSFVNSIDPEMLKRASAGNDTEALLTVINQAVQAGFRSSVEATTAISKESLSAHSKVLTENTLPEFLRKQSISSAVREGSEVFNNPAVSPMVSMLENQLSAKFPGATPEQIKTQAQKYFLEMSQEVVKANGMTVTAAADTTKSGNPLQREQQDWSSFITE